MADVKQLIKDYLLDAKLMQLATVSDGKPWVCSVWFAHDDNWNLYWISRKYRKHSEDLKENPNVAGAIVQPHTKGSGEKVRGLQFAGTARETRDDEIKIARDLYEAKYQLAEHNEIEELTAPDVTYGFYVIKPTKIVLFDEVNFPDDPRQEYQL